MKIKTALILFAFCMLIPLSVFAQDPIKLPPPKIDGGMPLMQALKSRETVRKFSSRELSEQTMSDLLWAAFGINRADTGKRTAPSAMNWQEVDLYVALKSGLYLYDAKANTLQPVLPEDIRSKTGIQPMAKESPVNIVLVADFARMTSVTKDEKVFYSATDAGYISQNIYLFCTSGGLVTGVRGLIDRANLAKVMNLRKDQKILLAHSVGFPGE